MKNILVGIGLAMVLAAPSASAGPVEDAGRRVYAQYARAVVPVSAVVKIEAPGMGRGPQEGTVNLFGTVIGEDGLTVISATSIAPFTGLTEQLEMSGVRPITTVTQIKIRLADGTQVPARQVLADEDLDLAFLMPEVEEGKPAPKWPPPVVFVAGASARPLDPVIALANAGQMLGWAVVVGTGQINAVVENPRRSYLITRGFTNATGVPVFLADGRPLGIAVTRRQTAGAAGPRVQVQQAILVLPADAVAEAAEQARAAAAK